MGCIPNVQLLMKLSLKSSQQVYE